MAGNKCYWRKLTKSWTDIYNLVRGRDILCDAYIIRSYFEFKIKVNESFKWLKVWLYSPRNQDKEKETIIDDSVNARFLVVRFLLPPASVVNFWLGGGDV